MKYKVEVKEIARQDILEASQWYERKQEGLGQRFTENILTNLQYLTFSALSHQCKYKENRELLVKNFPYVIVYRIANINTVIVLAVAHCKQHTSIKRKRK